MTTYYILAVYHTNKNKWFLDYGDYDKSNVEYEVYTLTHSDWNVKRKHTKIIKTLDNQQSIENEINKLNEEI